MTYPGALALTAGILFFVAILCGIATTECRTRNERIYATVGWVMVAGAAVCAVGSAWWAAS